MKSFVLAVMSLLSLTAGSPETTGYQVGDEVADFELKHIDGSMVSLSKYGDKGAIVIFDCNTCPYSKAYRERIKALDAMFADKGYPVIAVNSNNETKSPGDSYDMMKSYAAEHNFKHAYVYDEDQSVAKAFGATNTPHVYVVQKDGEEMVVKYIGAIDNNTKDAAAADKKYVEEAVNALLNGKNPEITKTKALGCTIKWAS